MKSHAQSPLTHYEIKVQGYLAPHWSDWFDGLELFYDEQENTILTGEVPDQAALHGLLNKIRDMSLTLISVTAVSSEDTPPQKKYQEEQ